MSTTDPVIVGFLCSWCAYRAADAAGVARISLAPNLRPILVMCSGRVDPEMVLKAFHEGADGVLIVGCHPGACHYVDGSLKALKRATLLRLLLPQLGLEKERVQLVWAAASEGAALASAIDRMSDRLRTLGPLQWQKTALRREGICP
jgi:F420-non-reducing hydrogenase iron-sulfur subunit